MSDNQQSPQTEEAPKGFIQRIIQKIDDSMKSKADEKAESGCCCNSDDKSSGDKNSCC